MLFLLTAFLTVESDCKDTHFFRYRMFLGDWCFFSWGDGDSFYLLCRFFLFIFALYSMAMGESLMA